MTNWITGPRCLDSMEKHGTKIWLFRNDNQAVVGFGSVGETRWRWPDQQSPYMNLSVIPAVAIHSAFQGMPKNAPREERYSTGVLVFLIAEARKLGHRMLVLNVHVDNFAAKSLYEFVGFIPSPEINNGLQKMFLNLSE